MSEPVPALGGFSHAGFAGLREIGPLGMITLRAAPDAKGLAAAIKAATGCKVPAARRIGTAGAAHAAWMSPDEYLLILPYDDVPKALAAIARAMAAAHHLAADVSDARAVFRIEGPLADQVLRKLTPADLSALAEGEIRRSRLAQVAAAFWADEAGYTLVCFRSVARYVADLLAVSASPGSELG